MECPGRTRATCCMPEQFSGDRLYRAFVRGRSRATNDSFEKIQNSPCCSMRFRERFGALIRKRIWVLPGKEGKKSRRVLCLHLLLSTYALGQSFRHLTDRSSSSQQFVSGRTHLKVSVYSNWISSSRLLTYQYRFSLKYNVR
jgi:hypothetical protein